MYCIFSCCCMTITACVNIKIKLDCFPIITLQPHSQASPCFTFRLHSLSSTPNGSQMWGMPGNELYSQAFYSCFAVSLSYSLTDTCALTTNVLGLYKSNLTWYLMTSDLLTNGVHYKYDCWIGSCCLLL